MDTNDRPSQRARSLLLLAVLGTVLLYVVPYGAYAIYPLLLLSTFAHEMGHGIAALIIGGEFHSFVLYADGSGMAAIAGTGGRFGSAFVSAGGLVGPSVLAASYFAAATRGRLARLALWLSAFAALASGIFVVRNVFGWIFVAAVAVVCGLLARKASEALAQVATAFVAVQLALSVYSRGDYLFTETAVTATGNAPSDVANMAAALWLPYWFWGGLCGAVSVGVVALGLWGFWRATRAPLTP